MTNESAFAKDGCLLGAYLLLCFRDRREAYWHYENIKCVIIESRKYILPRRVPSLVIQYGGQEDKLAEGVPQ